MICSSHWYASGWKPNVLNFSRRFCILFINWFGFYRFVHNVLHVILTRKLRKTLFEPIRSLFNFHHNIIQDDMKRFKEDKQNFTSLSNSQTLVIFRFSHFMRIITEFLIACDFVLTETGSFRFISTKKKLLMSVFRWHAITQKRATCKLKGREIAQ